MSEPITFFRKRRQDAGHTYTFDLESSTRVHRVFVYARSPVEEAVVRSRRLVDYGQEMKRIFDSVGHGGTVVQMIEMERTRSFQVSPVGKADSNFGSYGVLRPGAELSLEEVKPEKWLDTPAGTHLLVPVDREAEEHLRELKGFLGGLPPDLESLILYSIRKPSLDARIRDIEARSPQAAGTGLMSRIREWSIPILLVLILVLNVALYRIVQQDDGSAATGQDTTSQGENEGEEPEPAQAGAQDQKVFEILQTVRDKAGSVAAFASLLNGHFTGFAEGQDVAAALQDANRAQPLVLGLIKLEALRLDPGAASELFGTANNPSAVKDFFRHRNPELDSRDMLAALACAAYKAPGLPATKNGKSAALSFVPGQNCTSFPLDKATRGLEELLDFVRQYSAQGGASGGTS